MVVVLWGLCLLLGVAVNPGVEAESLYEVNSEPVPHSSCSGVRFSLESTIDVQRGVAGAPCVGYMNYDTEDAIRPVRRICGNGVQPTKAMAQRFCYTLGLNMWRDSPASSSSDDEVMLYDCDIYQEEGLEIPEYDSGILVAIVEDTDTPRGTLCLDGGDDHFCMDDCYESAIVAGHEDPCDQSGELDFPYWATTCTDNDECHNGALVNCNGAFPGNCDRRKACGGNTTCDNTIGGWECKCKYGYRAVNDDHVKDPYFDGCEDINECKEAEENNDYEDGEGLCGYNAQCINKPGYYICVCLRAELYDEEEHKCKKATCEALPLIPHAIPRRTPPTSPEYGDKVVYDCYRGYEVYGYYSYGSHNYFEVECDYSGHWKPYPLPSCVPIKCKHPGYVLYAQLSGTDWYYDDKIKYTCEHGYRPKGYSPGGYNYFEMTCLEDGTWSEENTCEDIDECTEQIDNCGNKHCINTRGSYMCSCSPWYYNAATGDYCDDSTGDSPCTLMANLGLCKYGVCYEEDGQAYCKCDPGYDGSMCDRRVDSAALIIAIVALVLIVIIIICLCLCCCCFCLSNQGVSQPTGGTTKVAPTYGLYGARPGGLPALRFVRKGY